MNKKIIIVGKHQDNKILKNQLEQLDSDVFIEIVNSTDNFESETLYLIELENNKKNVNYSENKLFFTWKADFFQANTQDSVFALPTYLDRFLSEIKLKLQKLSNRLDSDDFSISKEENSFEEENLSVIDSDLFTMTNIEISHQSSQENETNSNKNVSTSDEEKTAFADKNIHSDDEISLESSILDSPSDLAYNNDLTSFENTAPGILKRNNKPYLKESENLPENLKTEQGISSDNNKEKVQPAYFSKECNVIALKQCMDSGFTGIMEYKYDGKKIKLWWLNGKLGRMTGYGHVLSSILYMHGIGKHLLGDIARTPGDPIDSAIKRNLISSSDKSKYIDLTRQEVILDMVSDKSCIVTDSQSSLSLESEVKYLEVSGLILRGCVERLSPSFSWARGGGMSIDSINPEKWVEIINMPEIDPLWIRTVELFINGMDWTEACIKGGIGIEEGENLAFGLRLIDAAQPAIPSNQPYEDITRLKVLKLLDRSRTWTPEQFLGGTGATARRNYTEFNVFIEKLPEQLKKYMKDEIENLRLLLEKAFLSTQK